jgi:hypothetical protein
MAEERGKRKRPRWVAAFLQALERTGEAREAATNAGIDHTTAYARRKAHPEFASAWAEALRAHGARVKREEEEAIEALKRAPSTIASPHNVPPPRTGEELVVSPGKVRRAGSGRWSKEKEAIFFDELAATSNMRMAADAAGVSTNTILARRLKSKLFAAKFEAVVQSAKTVIDLYLVEETKKTFDPEQIDTGDVKPRVTIDQAIKISQINAKKARGDDLAADPFADEEAPADEDGRNALIEGIFGKLRRIREADRCEQLALGWSYDESFDVMIPPGWIQGPDYKPNPPELPINHYSKYPGG